MPLIEQLLREMTSNEPGPAGYQTMCHMRTLAQIGYWQQGNSLGSIGGTPENPLYFDSSYSKKERVRDNLERVLNTSHLRFALVFDSRLNGHGSNV